MSRLPPELIIMILELFFRGDSLSASATPDRTRLHPAVELSLVSRQWRNLNGPFLCKYIRLDNTYSILGLADHLRIFPNHAQYIERLSLYRGPEAVFGPDLTTLLQLIAKVNPNIEVLRLSCDLPSSESIVGLLNGLPLIKPSRIEIEKFTIRSTKKRDQFIKVLRDKCMQKWDTLTRVDFGFKISPELFLPAFDRSPSIQVINFSMESVASDYSDSFFRLLPLRKLVKNRKHSSLRIVIRDTDGMCHSGFEVPQLKERYPFLAGCLVSFEDFRADEERKETKYHGTLLGEGSPS